MVMMSPTKYSIMTAEFFRKQINAAAKYHDTEKEKSPFLLAFFHFLVIIL